jgi:hypothetical protein
VLPPLPLSLLLLLVVVLVVVFFFFCLLGATLPSPQGLCTCASAFWKATTWSMLACEQQQTAARAALSFGRGHRA